VADWGGVPADSTADIDMVGSSGREWTTRQTGEALDAGTAVAITSLHLESHQVGAMLPSLTPVLQVDRVDGDMWQQGFPARITNGAQQSLYYA